MKMTKHIDENVLARGVRDHEIDSKTEAVSFVLREMDRKARSAEFRRDGSGLSADELRNAVDPDCDVLALRVAEESLGDGKRGSGRVPPTSLGRQTDLGFTIPAPDLINAACALHARVPVHTANLHFSRIDGLEVIPFPAQPPSGDFTRRHASRLINQPTIPASSHSARINLIFLKGDPELSEIIC